jgi:hypothetical protein
MDVALTMLYTHSGQLCTGVFCGPVGSVGKTGWNWRILSLFSKTADIHSCVLENCAHPHPPWLLALCALSHFSSLNYGYYYLFLYSSTRFPPPVAA